ncbi:hydroxymethylglutaryl-CoA lyase [Vibrio profundum]|uniref:hydroxymethylglutaryl-CoA lyase n=1 Tax=Vibrio profundum TaxID=2910247 RepID=UPI003D12A8A3
MSIHALPSHVTIVEMGARDGLQNEPQVSTQAKVTLINDLSQTGLRHIEAGAFVSPKWVPQMADSAEVFSAITRQPDICYSALTPNMKAFEQALTCGANQVAVFASASEGFSKKNINCSIAESIKRFIPIINAAKQHNIQIRGYLSCVADCPYDGPSKPEQVAHIAQQLFDLGCDEISLGDTIGTGTPGRIARMLEAVMWHVPRDAIAVHFHDTWGQALANIYQALTMGVHIVDSSVAGLGGCPYAKGSSGNVATEDVLYLCQGLGIETGVDLNKLTAAGQTICQVLNKQPSSKVALALANGQ